jgi:IS5 family transposase
VLIIQRVYSLSDEQTEYQIDDCLSFQRFIGLDLSSEVPDYTTIWKFRERLLDTGTVDRIFVKLLRYIEKQGFIMKSGSIADAGFIFFFKRNPGWEDAGIVFLKIYGLMLKII